MKRLIAKFSAAEVLIVAGVISLLALWMFRPYTVPDTALVEPRLISLREPYQYIGTSSYADGGTIGIEIIDSTGRKELFSIPANPRGPRQSSVFVGAEHYLELGATAVANPNETRHALVIALSRHADDPLVAGTLAALSGRTSDDLRWIVQRLTRKFQRAMNERERMHMLGPSDKGPAQ